MSDLSLKARLLAALALTLSAGSLLAAHPSARYQTRMAYDAKRGSAILFGGLTAVDSGTKKAYYLKDTWEWTGSRWIQRFPTNSPSGRSSHTLAYDSIRTQLVLFGGRNETAELNDTWIYKDNDWTLLNTPTSPSPRMFASLAFDPVRDRMVLFGGTQTSADGKTLNPLHDTWEFDGTTWKQIGGEGPAVSKPLLVYDASDRKQLIMLGLDSTLATKMYSYDAAAGNWTEVKPTLVPPCVNEGALTYQTATQTILYTGGICATSPALDESYEWDGSNWTKVELKAPALRLFAAASTYDQARQVSVLFGGTPAFGVPESTTWLYAEKTWSPASDPTRPGPRSLFTLTADPARNTIWMFGGIDEASTFDDFWAYQNGAWQVMTAEGGPAGCITPASALDTDRQKLVVVCATADTFEWDGTAWKKFAPTTIPPFHRFGNMVYDQNLKKTVLFGGYDGTNYLDETWLWNGTDWTRERRNPAPSRSLAAMWYDPTLKKTVIYGGIGRVTSQDRITRYSDMWTFDGNGWAELKPAGGTPGPRYGAQVTIDPRSNHVLLFGGLRVDDVPPVPPATTPTQVQVYSDDMWEWDGTTWKKLSPTGVPPARENGAMAFDATRNEIILFGGYAGQFFSDMWTYNPTTWNVKIVAPAGGRRRVIP